MLIELLPLKFIATHGLPWPVIQAFELETQWSVA